MILIAKGEMHLKTLLGIEIRILFTKSEINANSEPYFLEPILNFEVAENAEIGYIIGKVLAKNTTKNLQYKIEDDLENKFQINEMNGIISLKNQLDYENGSNNYKLKVYPFPEAKNYVEVNIKVLNM